MSELPGVLAVALDNTAGLFSLSADTLAVLFFALQYAENLENWKDFPDEQLSTTDIDDIERLVGVATYEVLNMYSVPMEHRFLLTRFISQNGVSYRDAAIIGIAPGVERYVRGKNTGVLYPVLGSWRKHKQSTSSRSHVWARSYR